MAPYFVDSSLSVIVVAFGLAIVNGIAAFSSFFLPETSGNDNYEVMSSLIILIFV